MTPPHYFEILDTPLHSVSIRPVPVLFWHIMACLYGYYSYDMSNYTGSPCYCYGTAVIIELTKEPMGLSMTRSRITVYILFAVEGVIVYALCGDIERMLGDCICWRIKVLAEIGCSFFYLPHNVHHSRFDWKHLNFDNYDWMFMILLGSHWPALVYTMGLCVTRGQWI